MLNIGKFEHNSALQIHTLQAKQLIIENKSSATTPEQKSYMICGLERFSFSLLRIWRRIRTDDPYAEMVLIEVERRIDNALKLLDRLSRDIDDRLTSQLPGITLEIYRSKSPATISLNSAQFSTTHALLGARLIGLYDVLVRKLHTCKEFGVVNREYYTNYKYKSAKALRGVFAAPLLYKQLGVKRSDIIQKTEKGIEAVNKLGPVPLDILVRERRSEYGPQPINRPNDTKQSSV